MRVIVFFVIFVSCITNGFAQKNSRGEKGVSSVGAILGYAIESEKAVVGFDYRYNIQDKIRLAPSVLYVVKKNYTDSWHFNADAHYLSRITPRITLYPLGGLGVSVWNQKLPFEWDPELPGVELKSDTKLRLGLNMGFGGEMRVTKDLICGIEFRYNWTQRFYNQAMLLARAAYYF
jgi:opacity protein-like surface antigen